MWKVNVLARSEQYIHCSYEANGDVIKFVAKFTYAHNKVVDSRPL